MATTIKPIPLNVLQHTVTYEQFQKGDGINTSDSFLTAVTLSKVRVQQLSNFSRNTVSEELLYDSILFYDVVNSSGLGSQSFTEKSKITFNGKTMYIEKISPVEAFSLHHYELGIR